MPTRALSFFATIFLSGLSPVYADDAGNADSSDSLFDNVEFFGRVFLDYASLEGDNTAFDISDAELRTGRIGFKAKITSRVKIKTELEFHDDGDAALTDTYLEWKAQTVKFRLGQFKTPNSLEEATSSRFILLQERAAFTDAFQLDRRVGAAVLGGDERFRYSIGVFGQNIESGETFGGYALAGRMTFAPKISGNNVQAHIGLSARYRDVDNDEPALRYRQRPVSHIPGRILATSRIADSDFFAGAEAALSKNGFWVSGEYALVFADVTADGENAQFSGGYINGGYIFGGEQTMKNGKLDRPIVDNPAGKNGLGALAVTVRYDTLDLHDGAINGGAYDSYTLGVDWWPTSHFRLGLNGFIVDADLGTIASGLDPAIAAAVARGVRSETIRGVMLRAQFDFKT